MRRISQPLVRRMPVIGREDELFSGYHSNNINKILFFSVHCEVYDDSNEQLHITSFAASEEQPKAHTGGYIEGATPPTTSVDLN